MAGTDVLTATNKADSADSSSATRRYKAVKALYLRAITATIKHLAPLNEDREVFGAKLRWDEGGRSPRCNLPTLKKFIEPLLRWIESHNRTQKRFADQAQPKPGSGVSLVPSS